MSGADVVSLCFAGFPGTNRHLREISRVTALTRHLVVAASDPAAVDVTFLRDHVATLAPRSAIFGGWHAVYEPLLEAALSAGAEIAVLWTSSAVQTDFSGETATLAALLGDRRVGRFFAASEAMVGALAASGRPAHFLPHPFGLGAPRSTVAKPDGTVPIVSLFAGPNEYRRKNALASLVALAGLDVPYVVHLNGLAGCAEYRACLAAMHVPHLDRGWMDVDDYARALDEVDVGLQVSLADSFNYVVAEHFARAIPVVISRSVPVAHGLPADVARLLVVADPDRPDEIRAKLRFLLTTPDARRATGDAARVHLEAVSARNAELVRQALADARAAR